MPIDAVQKLIHLRTEKNKLVMYNIDRLWEISRNATTAQDILDGLHPWGKDSDLKFHNTLCYVFIVFGAFSLALGWLITDYIPFFFSILCSLLWFFIAYLSYESNDPIQEVIQALELKIKLLKFDLAFQKLPDFLSNTLNSALVIAKLKQAFPLFNQGTESNDIVNFASTIWTDEDSTQHPILLFKYHYVSEFSILDSKGKRQKIKKFHKDLWGVFVFQTEALGIAASNRRENFVYPYTQYWQSSDIELNQKLSIFGHNQQQLAKVISPSMTLKLSDFFQNNKGDLIIHFQENILCYMGEQNLFHTTSKNNPADIQNISELRGYLRTLDMPNYQQFKQRMLKFCS